MGTWVWYMNKEPPKESYGLSKLVCFQKKFLQKLLISHATSQRASKPSSKLETCSESVFLSGKLFKLEIWYMQITSYWKIQKLNALELKCVTASIPLIYVKIKVEVNSLVLGQGYSHNCTMNLFTQKTNSTPSEAYRLTACWALLVNSNNSFTVLPGAHLYCLINRGKQAHLTPQGTQTMLGIETRTLRFLFEHLNHWATSNNFFHKLFLE